MASEVVSGTSDPDSFPLWEIRSPDNKVIVLVVPWEDLGYDVPTIENAPESHAYALKLAEAMARIT